MSLRWTPASDGLSGAQGDLDGGTCSLAKLGRTEETYSGLPWAMQINSLGFIQGGAVPKGNQECSGGRQLTGMFPLPFRA